MNVMKLDDFLDGKQIEAAWKLYEECEAQGVGHQFAKRCEAQIIQPDIEVINTKLGQACDSRYLAYCVEYVFLSVDKQKGVSDVKGR